MRGRHTKRGKHDFLRRVVRLCLVMMVFLTLAVAALAWRGYAQLDAGVVGCLMGGWCGELLMSLLKRKFEVDDKSEKDRGDSEK